MHTKKIYSGKSKYKRLDTTAADLIGSKKRYIAKDLASSCVETFLPKRCKFLILGAPLPTAATTPSLVTRSTLFLKLQKICLRSFSAFSPSDFTRYDPAAFRWRDARCACGRSLHCSCQPAVHAFATNPTNFQLGKGSGLFQRDVNSVFYLSRRRDPSEIKAEKRIAGKTSLILSESSSSRISVSDDEFRCRFSVLM